MNPYVIAERSPDRPATIMASSGAVMSYRELDHTARRIAALLKGLGLKQGDHAAFLVNNELMYHPLAWGAWFAGLYFTPISTRLTPEEIGHILDDSGAKIVVASTEFETAITNLRDARANIEYWYLTAPGQAGRLPNIIAAIELFTPIATSSATIVGADMLYSSGTTGKPKGIKPPLGALRDDANALTGLLSKLYGLDENTRYLSPAPLYHGSPTKFTMAMHRVGGVNIIMESFDAEAALNAISSHRATHSQWVPTMFHRMMRLPPDTRTGYDLSSHQVAIHAAAPCPVELKRQMIEWWGPIIHEFYAGSEAIGFTTINSAEWLDREGSVGRAVLGEVHIMDGGRECAVGEIGDIYFAKGPALAYHNDPAKTARAYNERGWTTLGDVGRLDADGYLYLSDRKDFMIISGGVNVYPQEVEDVLAMHPEVADVAVFGVPNSDFGEEVKAVVQPAIWPDDETAYRQHLLEYCRARLSPIKTPRTIDLIPELPRQPNGKLYKRELRDRYKGSSAGRA